MRDKYFKYLLAQILQGEQPELRAVIDDFLIDNGKDLGLPEDFCDMTINYAIEWLKDNYDFLRPFIR